MRSKKSLNGFTLAMMLTLVAGMLLCTSVMNAEAANDPAKQIERKLSKLKREISTSPSILRITLRATGWKEEEVLEWTDWMAEENVNK